MKTSIVICAYNEERTVEDVVTSCCSYNPESEVILVDDGSTDNTKDVLTKLLKKYTYKYERLEKNRGKSWAMVHGVEIATGEIILFFDADVSKISENHFHQLLDPIMNNEADMVLGQPSETFIDYRINPFKSLTGQRALFKKDLIPILEDIKEIKFGVETYINLYFQAHGMRIKYVLLKDLLHPTKYQKTTPINATKEFIKEGKEIAIALVNNYELILQRIELHYNRVNKSAFVKINKLQREVNNKLQELKNVVDRNFR